MRFLVLFFAAAMAQADTLQLAQDQKITNQKAEASSQQTVNTLDDKRYQLVDEYRTITSETEQLQQYNAQLTQVIENQLEELVSLEKQIANIDKTERGILPLMQNMLVALESFVQLDSPFLLEERNTRVKNLKALLPKADVTVAEKYRRILEAYQIEVEYGRTLESYQGPLDDGRLVNFLRLGRVGFYYQTLNGKDSFIWAPVSKQWLPMDSNLNRSLRQSIRVAKQQVAPQMLNLAVSAEAIK